MLYILMRSGVYQWNLKAKKIEYINKVLLKYNLIITRMRLRSLVLANSVPASPRPVTTRWHL